MRDVRGVGVVLRVVHSPNRRKGRGRQLGVLQVLGLVDVGRAVCRSQRISQFRLVLRRRRISGSLDPTRRLYIGLDGRRVALIGNRA